MSPDPAVPLGRSPGPSAGAPTDTAPSDHRATVAPRHPSHGILFGVVLGIVVIVLLVAALWSAGWGPFHPPAGSPAPGTFRDAASVAQSAADARSGGPWTAIAGIGVSVQQPTPFNASMLLPALNSSSCTTHLLSGAAALTSLPAVPTSAAPGITSLWLVEFVGSASILSIAVLDQQATPFAEVSGPGTCTLLSDGLQVTPAGSEVDSSTAAATAFAHGGTEFESTHPRSDAVFTLSPGISASFLGTVQLEAPRWTVELTNCNGSGATLDGRAPAQFTAEINATDGAFVSAENTTAPCGSTPGGLSNHSSGAIPLGSGLTLKAVHVAHGGTALDPQFWYNTSVEMVGDPMHWSDVSFNISPGDHWVVPDPMVVNVTDSDGACPIAVVSNYPTAWGDPGVGACPHAVLRGGARVVVGDRISLFTGYDLLGGLGNGLVVLGQGDFSGSISMSISP